MQFYQLSQTSLAKSGSSVVESYIPLWMADGTYVHETGYGSGSLFIADGNSSYNTSSATSSSKLHTLNSNWGSSQQFAFEVTLYGNGGSACAELWDTTSNTAVSSSQVSTTSSTATVVRSGKFNLIPGHTYGITFWNSSPGNDCWLIDASLIVFGQ